MAVKKISALGSVYQNVFCLSYFYAEIFLKKFPLAKQIRLDVLIASFSCSGVEG